MGVMAVLNRQRVSTKNCSPPFSAKNPPAAHRHKDRAVSDVHEGSSSRASKRKRHDEQQQEEAERRRIEKQQQQQLEQYLKSRPPKKRILKPSDKMRFKAFNNWVATKHQSPPAVALDLNKAPPDSWGKRLEDMTDEEEDHGIPFRSSKGMRSWKSLKRVRFLDSDSQVQTLRPTRDTDSSQLQRTGLPLFFDVKQESGLPAS